MSDPYTPANTVTPHSLTLNATAGENSLAVSAYGDLDASTTDPLTGGPHRSYRQVVLDLQGIRAVDTAGMNAIRQVQRSLQGAGSSVTVPGLQMDALSALLTAAQPPIPDEAEFTPAADPRSSRHTVDVRASGERFRTTALLIGRVRVGSPPGVSCARGPALAANAENRRHVA